MSEQGHLLTYPVAGPDKPHLLLTGNDDVLQVVAVLTVCRQTVLFDARIAVRGKETIVLLHTERLTLLAASGSVYRQQSSIQHATRTSSYLFC